MTALNRRQAFRTFALAAAASLAFTSAAQAWSWHWESGNGEKISGSGEVVNEAREVGGFDAIAVSGGGIKVTVRQSSASKVDVRADKNLLTYIETKVVEGSKGRTLEISPKRGYYLSGSVAPQITLDMPALRAVSVAGAGEVKVEAMKTPSVDASIAGSGDIRFTDLNSERLGVKVAGSGDIVATGRTGSLDISVAGSGDVKTRGLSADEVKVSIAGSGDAQVQANKTLKVSIFGSGDVGYAGTPEVSTSVAGSGKVRRIGN